MNNLELLKDKLKIKPTIKQREKVAVVIKGEPKKPLKKSIISLKEELIENEESSDKEDIQKEETIINEEKQPAQDEIKEIKKRIPLIIDETYKGFNREELLKKLGQNKKIIISQKPFLEKEETKIDIKEIKKEENIKKPKKIGKKKKLLIYDSADDEDIEKKPTNIDLVKVEDLKPNEVPPEKEIIQIKVPKKRGRKTQKPEKGVAILGPEVIVEFGDTELLKRLPKKKAPVNIKVSSYYMNNREIFVNFINSLFEPYKRELDENKEEISCDQIGRTNTNFSLLTHQKIVRDYINLYTPYRGLLLYHGLGSGKTCTSIAIAEGIKNSKNVIVMTPASLRANYIAELKKCGDLFYKKIQYWEWISIHENPDALRPISAILNLPMEFINKHHGAFMVNVSKPSNYNELSDISRQVLEEQINIMISQKYQFINYNGLREKRLREMTQDYTKNIFDNSVIIIDEAHNFISRIVNKLKKEKVIPETKRGEKERLPLNLATKLYEMLLSAKNANIILLTGTPVINYPNEFGILFNILRGYIKTWKIPLVINTSKKIDKNTLYNMLIGEKSLDYLDYSPSSKTLTITRNPFGFKNKIKKDTGYQGVTKLEEDIEYIDDDKFENKIIRTLIKNDIDVITDGIEIKYRKALPDNFDEFVNYYIDENTRKLKNVDALKNRILGLSSYFRSAQESLLPSFNKQLGVDYHIIRIHMSDLQFKIYEAARKEERKLEKRKPKSQMKDDFEDKVSTYRIFSRLICNFAIPERPMPIKIKKKKIDVEEKKEINEEEDTSLGLLLKEAKKIEGKQDIGDEHEGELEGDEVLNELGGISYMEQLQNKLKSMEEFSNDFFTPEALQNYSPKFLNILENIQDDSYIGLHLLYSQFRTAEGIGLMTLVLNKNGFTQFKIKKNQIGIWEIDIPEIDEGKPTYALYTGTETSEEKEIIRHIYNSEWNEIPDSIGNVLKSKYRNNFMGEVIKLFMITSSGSEGINLRNTRYVHIMDPYWHPVRAEQVIGRARRICSHKDLPKALQTVEVFVYLMIFSEQQLLSDEAIELKRKDLSKIPPKIPFTSDQYLYEISEIKLGLTNQLTETIKESAFDCYLYSNGKCVNFGDPTKDKFSFVPDYSDQQNDITSQANKTTIEWKGKPITINGVEYVYRKINSRLFNIYDISTYKNALNDPTIIPLQIGTIEINDKGEKVFKQLI
jgi:hypothetical protein